VQPFRKFPVILRKPKVHHCGLEVNIEKIKYILLSRHQNAGQNHDIKTANRSFENVAQFRSLGRAVTNQNLIQEGFL
jgi:hypothetical protein